MPYFVIGAAVLALLIVLTAAQGSVLFRIPSCAAVADPLDPCVRAMSWYRDSVPVDGHAYFRPEPVDALLVRSVQGVGDTLVVAHGSGISFIPTASNLSSFMFPSGCGAWKLLGVAGSQLLALHSDPDSCVCPFVGPCSRPAIQITLPNGTSVTISADTSMTGPNMVLSPAPVTAELVTPLSLDPSLCTPAANMLSMGGKILVLDEGDCAPAIAFSLPLLFGQVPVGAMIIRPPGQPRARLVGADGIPFPTWSVSADDGALIRSLIASHPGQALNITFGATVRNPADVLAFGSPSRGLVAFELDAFANATLTGELAPASSDLSLFATAGLGFLETALGGARPILWLQKPNGYAATAVLFVADSSPPVPIALFTPSFPPVAYDASFNPFAASVVGDILTAMAEMKFFVDGFGRHILVGLHPPTRLLVTIDVSNPTAPTVLDAHLAISVGTTGLTPSDASAGRFFFPLAPASKFADLSWTPTGGLVGAGGFARNRLFLDTTSGPKVLSAQVVGGRLVVGWGVQGVSVVDTTNATQLPTQWQRAIRTLSAAELFFSSSPETFGVRQIVPQTGVSAQQSSSAFYVNARPNLLVGGADYASIELVELALVPAPELFPYSALSPLAPSLPALPPSPANITFGLQYPSLDIPTVGSFVPERTVELHFDQDMYYSPPACATASVGLCTEPVLAECCGDCLVPNSPLNSPGCLCPLQPGAICLGAGDVQQGVLDVLLLVTVGAPTFEFGVRSACLPFALTLEALTGNANMLLSWQSGQAYADRLGNDYFLFCTSDLQLGEPSDPSVVSPQDILKDRASTDPFARVSVRIVSSFLTEWRLTLTAASPLAPVLTFPVYSHYHAVPLELRCDRPHSVDEEIVCANRWPSAEWADGLCMLRPVRPGTEVVAAVVDRANARAYYDGGWPDFSPRSDRLFYGIPVGIVLETREIRLDIDVSTCTVVARPGSLVDALGRPLLTNITDPARPWLMSPITNQAPLTPLDRATPCNASRMLTTTAVADEYLHFDHLLELIYRNAGTLDFVGLIASCRTNDRFSQVCESTFGAVFYQQPSEPQLYNTTYCLLPPGSPEYAIDPCCNVTLQAEFCCAPREILAVSYDLTTNDANISRICRDVKCAANAVQQSIRTVPPATLVTPAQYAVNVVCTSDYSVAFQEALYNLIVADVCAALLNFYEAGIYPCEQHADCLTDLCLPWGACAPPTNDLPKARCLYENLVPGVRSSILPYNTSLEAFLERYLPPSSGASVCNYDSTTPATDCVTPTVIALRTEHFCALPLENGIREVSVFGGCAEWDTATFEILPFLCAAVPDKFTASPRLLLDGRCWITGLPSVLRDACLPPSLCGSEGLECPPMCWVDIPRFACNCQFLGLHPACDRLAWMNDLANPNTGTPGLCVFVNSESFGAGLCELGDYMHWWPGHVFVPSLFNDEQSCLAGGCASPSCPGCGVLSCLSEGLCSDASTNAACVFSPVGFNTITGALDFKCTSGDQVLRDYGCVNPALTDKTECERLGGIWLPPPATNLSTCLAYQTCYSNLGLVERLRADECTECGHNLQASNSWDPAVYYLPGQLQWRNRTVEVVVPASSSISTGRFRDDVYSVDVLNASFEVFASAVRSGALCSQSRIGKTDDRIACACGAVDAGETTVLCQHVADKLATLAFLRPCQGARSLVRTYGAMRFSVSSDSVFSVPCFEITFYDAQSSLFSKNPSSALDSAFVRSLELREHDVIKNSRGIVVGRLVGSGAMLMFDPVNATIVRGGELCLFLDHELPGKNSFFSRYDFAYAVLPTGSSDDLGERARKVKLREMGLQLDLIIDPQSQLDMLCANISLAGIYVPIARHSSSKDLVFFDTLSAGQQASLIILVIFYFFLWCASMLCASVYLIRLLYDLVRPQPLSRRSKRRVLLMGTVAFLLINALSFIRWILFLVVAVGAAADAPPVVVGVLSELPTYLFLSIFTVLIVVWGRTIIGSNKRVYHWGLFALFLVANLILWVWFLAYVIVYAVFGSSDNSNGRNQCGEKDSNAGRNARVLYVVAAVYHFIVATLAVMVALAFMVVLFGVARGMQLPHMFREARAGNVADVRGLGIFFFWTTMVLFSGVALLAQAILLVVTSFESIPTVAAMILILFIEFMPCLTILLTLSDFVRDPLVRSCAGIFVSGLTLTSDSTSGATGGPAPSVSDDF